MNRKTTTPPDLEALVALFYSDAAEFGQAERVTPPEMPDDCRRLLAHDEHMTVTVEAFHGSLVDVKVLETHRDTHHYSRKILLTRQSDGRVVQFGIVRLDLRQLPKHVAAEIQLEETPLGRILIQNQVLRHVELASLWRIRPGADLCRLFQLDHPEEVYGRTALIYCNGEPAVELIEVVLP